MSKIKSSLQLQTSEKEKDKIWLRGVWGPKLHHWRDVIEDYLSTSRKRFDNKLSMYKLQLAIMNEIFEGQTTIKELKKAIKNPQENGHEFDNADLRSLKTQLGQEKLLLKTFRELADGHLWRIFKFNRPLLHFLGKEPAPGYLRSDQSFIAELQSWATDIMSLKVSHFILNDISNFARIGDSIIRQSDGTIEVKEIKSSKSQRFPGMKERLERQAQKRKDFVLLANSGEVQLLNKKAKIIESQIPYKTSLKLVQKALVDSETNGISSRKISSYLNIVCVDLAVAEKLKIMKEKIDYHLDTHGKSNFDDRDTVIPITSAMRTGYSPNFTPLSILPFSEQIIADLLLGKKLIVYFFNVDEFFRLIEKRNWQIITSSLNSKSLNDQNFCHIKHNNLTLGVSGSLVSQIIFDTLDFNKFIESLDFIHKNQIRDADRLFVNFDEGFVWR